MSASILSDQLLQSHCKCGVTQSSAAHTSADSKVAALLLKLLKNNSVTGWYCAREPDSVIDSMNSDFVDIALYESHRNAEGRANKQIE
jgi:hypothetical protein